MIIEKNSISNISKLNKIHSVGLGFYDGIHLGHVKVIKTLVSYAKQNNTVPTIITFSYSPKQVLNSFSTHKFITPNSTRIKLFKSLGIECVIILPFTQDFSKVTAEKFINNYLLKINVDSIFAGMDFRFGANKEGTIEYLNNYLLSHNIPTKLYPVDFAVSNGQKISASTISKLIVKGDFEEVSKLLGRNYSVSGTVVYGRGIGKKIGFPTANLDISHEFFLPETGVYAVKVLVNEKIYLGMANIGYAPTIDLNNKEKTTEINIFDFDFDIYGNNIEVFWYSKIRDEQKFSNIELLVAELNKDKEKVMEYFKTKNGR